MTWKALIVAALLCLAPLPSLAVRADPGVTRTEWAFVCNELRDMGYARVNCRTLDKPIVVVTQAVDDLAEKGTVLYGLSYDGEDYILINPFMEAPHTRAVVVHETVHYVLYRVYHKVIGECKHEEIARRIQAKWTGLPYTTEWREVYGCK